MAVVPPLDELTDELLEMIVEPTAVNVRAHARAQLRERERGRVSLPAPGVAERVEDSRPNVVADERERLGRCDRRFGRRFELVLHLVTAVFHRPGNLFWSVRRT
ncbi:hypothetical protein ZOD2009_18494 [Haladaptatus paucihalophilus DX253]|uniref:Uncharacterized protein n=1 Tax=Haladaptatus paucihalophilus DX253 TaxID=797209 RepID=E7QY09_HALPU|nr:hypothetical protein [Haladaptatus paucihalophilus]EFW90475.1 hypothetical protein ZOD2009_18494 [Haladaptatus paucihalophilus DX253]